MAHSAQCEFDVVPPPGTSAGDVGVYIDKILGGSMQGPDNGTVSISYVGSLPFRKARIRVEGSEDDEFFRKSVAEGVKRSYWDLF